MKTTLKSTLKALLTLTFILTLLLNGTAFAQSAFDQTAAENLALEAAGATRERALLFPTEIETEHGQKCRKPRPRHSRIRPSRCKTRFRRAAAYRRCPG